MSCTLQYGFIFGYSVLHYTLRVGLESGLFSGLIWSCIVHVLDQTCTPALCQVGLLLSTGRGIWAQAGASVPLELCSFSSSGAGSTQALSGPLGSALPSCPPQGDHQGEPLL